MPWDPACYEHFKKERYKPFEDLIRMVRIRPNLKVVDLGCGTGELTLRLMETLPGSDVVGMDSSPQMLERAAPLSKPGLRFELRLIENLEGQWDLVFSHAAIQWVENHHALIARLFSHVREGGQLTIQTPSNHDHPVLKLIVEVASGGVFREAMGNWSRQSPVLPLQEYAETLYSCGGTNLNVFEKVYPHILPDSDALADWTSGTVLVPYMERLTPKLQADFMAEYRARLKQLYPQSPVLFGFKRILFSADKGNH